MSQRLALAAPLSYAVAAMSIELTTKIGSTYVVTPAMSGTVSTTDGVVIVAYEAGAQVAFVAPAETVVLSDDGASVTETFKLAASAVSGGGESSGFRALDATPLALSSNAVGSGGVCSALNRMFPVGSYVCSARPTLGKGFLLCDGQAVSRTAYHALFAVIGTTYGAGDGSRSFNLPDFRGRVAWGADGTHALGCVIEAGIPNVEGSWTNPTRSCEGYKTSSTVLKSTGAAYWDTSRASPSSATSSGSSAVQSLAFDASRISAVYGRSDTVQPPAVAVNVFIRALPYGFDAAEGEAELPGGALPAASIHQYFAAHAQPGAPLAPAAVYVSRVPWARYDDEAAQWVNTDCAVNEAVFGVARKLMDNAGLQHACSTDSEEGADDYTGRLWPFFWQHGNYVTDEYGVKHLTAIRGTDAGGSRFDPTAPTCAFGPSFYFFCKPELWQNPETGEWSTHDGTKTGTPLFQLWGISARPWSGLDERRREELLAHGVGEADFTLWPECRQWCEASGSFVERPYWIHAAYCAGREVDADGVVSLSSKRNLPPALGLSGSEYLSLCGSSPGMRGSACVQGFSMLFDIVKNATKDSQSLHRGMADNSCSPVLASAGTSAPGYVFPIAEQGDFAVGGTVWLGQVALTPEHLTDERSPEQQIGRIASLETRLLAQADGSTVSSLCLVLDAETVEPFLVCSGSDADDAIAATAALTDAGSCACCYAMQGPALAGETDAVIGSHDGSCTSLSDGRHPYRVQGTEYMTGCGIMAADLVALAGTGETSVKLGNSTCTPTNEQLVLLHAGPHVPRLSEGGLQDFVAAGYVPLSIYDAGIAGGYIVNERLEPQGVALPVDIGGAGSSDASGMADIFLADAQAALEGPLVVQMGGTLAFGAQGGAAALSLGGPMETAWMLMNVRD